MNGESIHVQHDTDCVAKQNRPSCILPIVINSLAHKETQQVSQFLDCPTTAAQRIIRYIKISPAEGLCFQLALTLNSKRFSDSDWGTCLDTRRSITGFFFLDFHWLLGKARNNLLYLNPLRRY
ncbi:hypothetical protein AAZV13_13G238100 [Glycine max]|nr:hypothetical protein JHK87_037414 [Glycine soja]KHN36840.1 Putative mitochondrial protein [Glycine soja]